MVDRRCQGELWDGLVVLEGLDDVGEPGLDVLAELAVELLDADLTWVVLGARVVSKFGLDELVSLGADQDEAVDLGAAVEVGRPWAERPRAWWAELLGEALGYEDPEGPVGY